MTSPKPPQEDHVSKQMHDVGMHESRADPLNGMQPIAEGQHPALGLVTLQGGKEGSGVNDDQGDRHKRKVIDRSIGIPRNQHGVGPRETPW